MNGGPIKRWMFMRQHHWTAARLSEYLDGELSDRDRARVEQHTGMCPACSRVLATLRPQRHPPGAERRLPRVTSCVAGAR